MLKRLLLNRNVRSFLLLCLIVAGDIGIVTGQEDRGEVYVATLEGVINPLSDSYLSRAISQAEKAGARALVFQLDTPGGLETSMRKMTQAILQSKVPVIVYVAPSGARAASAGMFITISAHVAAMAPGTNIGAATPVSLGGGEQQQDETLKVKVVEDAAATARSLAALRGRNSDWAERAVREGISASSDEALKLNVVDLIAPDLPALLEEVEGRQVETAEGEVTLRVQNTRQVPIPMTPWERLLHIITDPNIAYLLFTLGMIGIIAELYNPGTLIPGIIGVISLALAFVALGALPIGWAGVGLILLAVGLMIGEIQSEGFGVLGIGSVVAFFFGSLLLFVPVTPVSPSLPEVRVSLWVVVLMTATVALFFIVVIRKAVETRRQPVATGIESMLGKQGRVVRKIDPVGTVVIGGEEWTAESEGRTIEAGTEVEVVEVSGVTVRVMPLRSH